MMVNLIRIFFILTALFAQTAFAQEARIIKLPELQRLLSDSSSRVHVVNFWATWCGPCVKELPQFEKLNAEKRPDLKVTLVSLDLDLDPNPEKVFRFVKSRDLRSEVVLLDESNPDSWIDQIDKRWSGALPFTIIIDNQSHKRIIIDKALDEGQLENYLNEIQ